MNSSIDFLDFKIVFRYVIAFAIVLIGGAFLKDIFALLITGAIIYYVVTKNLFRSLELWLIWFFSIGFYSGQGYIQYEAVAKYIAKPSFLLFVIFIGFFNRIPSKFKSATFTTLYVVYIVFSLLSSLFHDQSPFVLITLSSFFLLYLLFRSKDITYIQCRKFLNLFMSVAMLQTIVCVLQITNIIPPSTASMDDGTGGQMDWVAGLDDVASGTFGSMSSHIVSWYASFILLFCILVWSVCKKQKYLVMALIALAQFGTIDSKTVLAVTILMILYLLNYLKKNRSHFRLNIRKLASIITFVLLTGIVLFNAIDFYYQYQSKEGGAINRTNLNDVYEKEVKESRDAVMNNIGDWGKIQGFRYIYEDYLYNDPLDVFWGYGLMGYTYNGRMAYIESKDTRVMQMNNFTRSRSGLISTFAQNGCIGFLLFMIVCISWYRYNITRKNVSPIDVITNGLVRIFLPFTLLAAFVCSVLLTSITVISFAALVGLLHRYSQLDGMYQQFLLAKLKADNNAY